MTFTEFAQMLYPFYGKGKFHSDFVVTLVGNIIDEPDNAVCSLLEKPPEYLARIYGGTKPFPRKDASFVLGHLKKEKFESFISDATDDTIEELRLALSESGVAIVNKYEVAARCADTFVEVIRTCANTTRGSRQQGKGRLKSADPFAALRDAEALLASLPAPTQLEPPKQPTHEEQAYISELYAAYGDREGVTNFDETHLSQYGEYDEDIKDRRIDYFAAESIRRGVSELYSGQYANQFDVLKDETLSGVKNTARRAFPNGYERMLCVMEQAAIIEVRKYMLSQSPNWISNRIKMGVCHFLVNENKLKWVK